MIGTDFNDGLFGNNEVNTIEAGAGDDLVHGFAGDDFLDGGEGTDTVLFSAAPAGVVVDLNDQVEDVTAQGAGFAATGGAGNNVLSGFENVVGSQSDDTITGDQNDNLLNGNGGDDTLIGGAGDDVLAGGGGTDIIDGGDGIDTNSFAGIGLGVTATLNADGTGTATYGQVNETFVNIENLTGSDNDDILIATGAAANTIFGGAGDDFIAGGGGTDILDGGDGIDTNSFQGISGDVTLHLSTEQLAMARSMRHSRTLKTLQVDQVMIH